ALRGPPAGVAMSPDRSRLLLREAVGSEFELAVTDRHGRERIATLPLPTFPRQYAWAPDAARVAFLADSGRDRTFELSVWDTRDGRVVRPPVPPITSLAVPTPIAWSPDGRRMAFLAPAADSVRRLYLLDPDDARTAPRVVLDSLAPHAGIAWSPDGRRLATVRDSTPGELTLVGADGAGRARVPVAPGGRLHDLAWSADGARMLMVVSWKDADFNQLAEVELATGRVRALTAEPGRVASPHYSPDGASYSFAVHAGGEVRTMLCARAGGCRRLGPDGGISVFMRFAGAGDSVFFWRSSPYAAAAVRAEEVRTGRASVLYAPMPENAIDSAGAERLSIPAPDGVRLPAYLWRGRRVWGHRPALVIAVPGGPAAHQEFAWEPRFEYLHRAGIDVVTFNYRGQAGFGSEFLHAPGDEEARARDVLAVRDYAVRTLGIPPERVAIYGHSYGAYVAMRAAAMRELPGPLVVVSTWGALPDSTFRVKPRCVAAFNGGADERIDPGASRKVVEAWLGEASTREPCGHFRVFPGERHWFEDPQPWAVVYATLVSMLPQGPNPLRTLHRSWLAMAHPLPVVAPLPGGLAPPGGGPGARPMAVNGEGKR
ncbi:MAG TPA: alpha/beta fold hydrolase, partial [Longimicrobiaceae bacterium]|nr:alpha/beta fold hydrolase [Longimicrobiaceae bacterium]